MATFIHIFTEDDKKSLLRNGIKLQKTKWRNIDGVFVSPVTEDYYFTHQWHREVNRVRNVPKLVARIKIPDDELVYLGKYNEEHVEVTASKAIGIARKHDDPHGLEVIIPRRIEPNEIQKVYKPTKIVGWRYHPKAKGTKPCGCSYCQRGEPKSKRIREEYEKDL